MSILFFILFCPVLAAHVFSHGVTIPIWLIVTASIVLLVNFSAIVFLAAKRRRPSDPEIPSVQPSFEVMSPPLRSVKSRIVEPVTPEEFHHHLQKLAEVIVEYVTNSRKYKNVTPNASPGFLYNQFPKTAPEEPIDLKTILGFYNDTILEAMTHWQHPNFFAYFGAGRNYPDMMADLLISSLGIVGFSWDSGPAVTELEHAMINWVGRALGIPESHLFTSEPAKSIGGGAFYESASEAEFCAIMAARQWKIHQIAAKSGKELAVVGKHGINYDHQTMHEICSKLVYYTSKDAHSSMEKGCKLAMVHCRPIAAKEENDWGVTGQQLEKKILKDKLKGLIPTFVLICVGTTSTAATDHVESMMEVANSHGLWVHIDAAYAGSFWLDPKYRVPCIHDAWSIMVNMHKCFEHSVNYTILWVKEKKLIMDAFVVTPIYLKPTHENSIDLRDWGVNLSRRFKGLKTWMILSMFGLEGMRRYHHHIISMAHYFMSLIVTHPNLSIFGGKMNYNLFCFQYEEPGMSEEEINEATSDLCRYINETHLMFFTHTRVGCYNLIRVTIVGTVPTRESIDESWELLKKLIRDFKKGGWKKMKSRDNVPLLGDDVDGVVGSIVSQTTASDTSVDMLKQQEYD